MTRICIVAVLCAASFAPAQQPTSKPNGRDEPLATVTTKPDHHRLLRGQDLGVTLTLRAGARGAYLPNFFGDWVNTCQSGFSVDIFTLQGTRVSTSARGCAGDFFGSGPPVRELLRDYVFLKPGERRSWHTTLTNIVRAAGDYEVKAEYFSAQRRIEEVAALPEVHGLMVIGHVQAQPVPIRIR